MSPPPLIRRPGKIWKNVLTFPGFHGTARKTYFPKSKLILAFILQLSEGARHRKEVHSFFLIREGIDVKNVEGKWDIVIMETRAVTTLHKWPAPEQQRGRKLSVTTGVQLCLTHRRG